MGKVLAWFIVIHMNAYVVYLAARGQKDHTFLFIFHCYLYRELNFLHLGCGWIHLAQTWCLLRA